MQNISDFLGEKKIDLGCRPSLKSEEEKTAVQLSWFGIIRNSKRKFKIPKMSREACQGHKAILNLKHKSL